MNIIEAIILGLVQGLTEFLPVSSSGHLEIGHALFGIKGENNLLFDIVVHGATVLSTLVVFWKEIVGLLKNSFRFKVNESNTYLAKLLFSAIPVAIGGVLFSDQIEALFTGNIVLVGSMLLVTATLLTLSHFIRKSNRKTTFADALLIGFAQLLAVIPGISRSGATIATGMMLGNDKSQLAKFSFLMVIIPILGANLLKILSGDISAENSIGFLPLAAGFIAAFLSGLLACKWMINLVKRGKLIYFAIYCSVIGLIAIFAA
ncbi:MAG: undecaprenyl-diphosphate phosphatase [Prolixibacteraceae bacterium]|nr:undecaprenyl-diphosphate phosphatase [Prolixibacteraceae bacterium]